MKVSDAILAIVPEAEFSIIDEDYGQLTWFSEDITKPTLLEVEAKLVELRNDEPMRILREERDRLLTATDWWAVSDRTMTDEQLAYRQALRDLPSTSTPVLDSNEELGISGVTWPTKP